MSEYTLTQAEYKRFKTQLTRKRNQFDKAAQALRTDQFNKQLQDDVVKAASALLCECKRALGVFADKGYPDSWSNWERAKEDAEFQIQRYSRGPGIYSW